MGYALVRSLVRLLLSLFYRRIEVVGAEQVPRTGPLIVAANHHNSVVDAMLLVAVMPRRLCALANAPLFQHPLIGPFLRLLGALPVHRRQEAGSDPARNAALFEATTATLRAGGAILIFPEGRTQPEPVLQTLRTGTARMLLAAEADAGATRVTLLPVGLVFHEPGTFRAGRALVWIGEPVSTDGLAPAAAPPERAAQVLTDRLTEALGGQIVEADDRHTLRLLGLLEELWREETATAARGDAARVAWLQQAMRAYRALLLREPVRVAAFRRELEAFAAELERAGLVCAQLSRSYPPGAVARYSLREGLFLALGAPLALCGIVIHAVPYQLTAAVVRHLHRTDEEEATDKLFAGLLFYPLAWTAESYLAVRLGGIRALPVFLAALPATGFFALAWNERFESVGREARAFVRFLRDRDLPRRLRAQRRALAAELAELARLAPEARAE